jgi:hypothetical protein
VASSTPLSAQKPLPTLTTKEQQYAIKTWRYLRLALIALVVGLGAAVLYEWIRGGADCWQTSISAYYYTHAQAIFVGGLIAIGTCLICLRGSEEVEDILLNVAGMLAPVVALVPTPNAGSCTSLPGVPQDPTPNIENNITALLITGVVAFLVLAVLSWRQRQPTAARAGYGLALVLLLAGGAMFVWERTTFVDNAHGIAALLMFGCIIAVAWINALSFKRKQDDPNASNRYSWIAVAMLSAPLLYVFGGTYRVLYAEIDALVLFAIFWALQTEELWGEGVRQPDGHGRPAARQVAVPPAEPATAP